MFTFVYLNLEQTWLIKLWMFSPVENLYLPWAGGKADFITAIKVSGLIQEFWALRCWTNAQFPTEMLVLTFLIRYSSPFGVFSAFWSVFNGYFWRGGVEMQYFPHVLWAQRCNQMYPCVHPWAVSLEKGLLDSLVSHSTKSRSLYWIYS